MFAHEQELWAKGYTHIAGVDEAGAGAFFGPLVAGCVILDPTNIPEGLNDSKQLSPKKRDQLYDKIVESALAWGVGVVDHATIDQINPKQASRLAMRLAVESLKLRPDFLLIDFHRVDVSIPQRSFEKADATSATVAAGSIMAKVTRDRMITEMAGQFHADYDLAGNKGYGSPKHQAALLQHGPTPYHRLTFIRKTMAKASMTEQ